MEIPSESAYRKLVKGEPLEPSPVLSLEQRMQLDTLKALNSINGKLMFFVVLAIIAIVVSLIF